MNRLRQTIPQTRGTNFKSPITSPFTVEVEYTDLIVGLLLLIPQLDKLENVVMIPTKHERHFPSLDTARFTA